MDIAAIALVLFVNLFGLFYGLARLVFLKNTGVKLHHLDVNCRRATPFYWV